MAEDDNPRFFKALFLSTIRRMGIIQKWKERGRVLQRCMQNPRFAYALLENGLSSRDQLFLQQFSWIHGSLPRVPMDSVVPAASAPEIRLIWPLDRKQDTSISVYELSCLLAIAQHVKARRVLEIGTVDGNTALNLAAHTDADVVTLDLPPDFDPTAQASGGSTQAINNMTPREELGRQLRDHPFGSRVKQVFGDSTKVDWRTFRPPFELVFIDGCHKYPYVLSDSENARACLTDGGVIVWHDYGIFQDVSRAVDQIATNSHLRTVAIEGTRLAVGFA
jgi:predicted O-methyltransferase YrrM